MHRFRRALKLVFLVLARSVGVFAVARAVTRRQLRILCYHGIGTDDEVAFSPELFISLETLRKRFEILRAESYQVLPLADAVKALAVGTLPRHPVVITFDDALFGNLAGMSELRRAFAFPMTLYVTTYYVTKGTPIFRLCVRYMLWKSRRSTLL